MSPVVPSVLSTAHPLLLGSGSPRRRELLGGVGVPLLVRPASVDESPAPDEAAGPYLTRMAEAKLRAVAEAGLGPARAALVADTTVVLDGRILGKPDDDAHALEMLLGLSGREHSVSTAYAISLASDPFVAARLRTVTTRVFVRAATRDELQAYVATGECRDKAGAYAIQGSFAYLIERIDGSYTNVVGLPLCEVVSDLRSLGLIQQLALPPS